MHEETVINSYWVLLWVTWRWEKVSIYTRPTSIELDNWWKRTSSPRGQLRRISSYFHRVMHPVNLLVVLYISRLEVGGYYPAMRALLAFCDNSWKGGQSEIYSQHSNNHRGNLNMSLSSNLLKLRQTDLLSPVCSTWENIHILPTTAAFIRRILAWLT